MAAIPFSKSMLIAIAAVFGLNYVVFASFVPWFFVFSYRYYWTSITCDAISVVLIKFIKDTKWTVRTRKEATKLSLWIALIYGAFTAPYNVSGLFSAGFFAFEILHKFAMSFVALIVMDLCKKYD